MTEITDGDLERALRRTLKPVAQRAPLPDGVEAIPSYWVRDRGRVSRSAQIAAPLAVAMVAAGATWATLAFLDRTPDAPLMPATTLAPVPSAVPSQMSDWAFPSPPVPDSPPAVTIGGVAGEPVTWCYGNGCVDGVYVGPVEGLPAAGTLGPVEAPAGSEVTSVRVFASDGTSADVPSTGFEIGPLPAGSWERLSVSVAYGVGSDALYMWRLALGP